MHDPNVQVSDDARPADLQFLEEQINEYNFATTGLRDARLLTIVLRESAGRIYAGIGSLLLRAAEEEARSRGCVKIVLSTHSFREVSPLIDARSRRTHAMLGHSDLAAYCAGSGVSSDF